MISSRKCQLVIAVISVCICSLALCQEPNAPRTELKFEISKDEKAWIQDSSYRPGVGPIKPTHAAEFHLRDPGPHTQLDLHFSFKSVPKTKAGESLSQAQRDFLIGSDAWAITGQGNVVRHCLTVCLYAVSEDDAKRMAEALIEGLTDRTNTRMQGLKNRLGELEGKIAEAKRRIAEAEAEHKNTQPELERVGKNVHYRDHLEAEEEVVGFNKMLNTLNIELSGIRARLATIEFFQAKGKVEGHAASETVDKLEQMYVEQTIELKAAEAKVNTTTALRRGAETFVNLSRRLQAAESNKHNLSNDLKRYEADMRSVEGELADLTPKMPPKVFQNKVTIYPVRAEE